MMNNGMVKEASEFSRKKDIVCTSFVQKSMLSVLNLSCNKLIKHAHWLYK